MYKALSKFIRARVKFYLVFLKSFVFSASFRDLLLKTIVTGDELSNIELLRKLLRLNPTWAKGHYMLGTLSADSAGREFTALSNRVLERLGYAKRIS